MPVLIPSAYLVHAFKSFRMCLLLRQFGNGLFPDSQLFVSVTDETLVDAMRHLAHTYELEAQFGSSISRGVTAHQNGTEVLV